MHHELRLLEELIRRIESLEEHEQRLIRQALKSNDRGTIKTEKGLLKTLKDLHAHLLELHRLDMRDRLDTPRAERVENGCDELAKALFRFRDHPELSSVAQDIHREVQRARLIAKKRKR